MEGTLQQINLSDIGDTVGTPPSSSLVGSVRRNGVVQPIVLAESPDENGEIRLRLIDGNRRVKAARSSKLSSIPAIVLTDIEPETISQLTLILNGFRAGNYLSEFWAIKQLEKQQLGEKEILSISGLSKSMVKKRTDLADLNRELFVALRNGKIYQTHAAAIARLPKESQSSLASLYRQKGRVGQTDIDQFKPPKKARSEPPSISDSLERLAWSAQPSQSAIGTSIPPAGQPGPGEYRSLTPTSIEHNASPETPPGAPTDTMRITQSIEHPPEAPQPSSFPNQTGATTEIRSDEVQHASPPEPTEQPVPTVHQPRALTEPARDTSLTHHPSGPPHNSEVPDQLHATANTRPGLIPGESVEHFTPVESREIQLPTTASRAVSSMRNAVIAAQLLDFSKEEFLELAGRIWDETISQQTEHKLMHDQAPREPFPDLAAHKWDTGES